MGQVCVEINGRSFLIACDHGQEDRLIKLSQILNARVNEVIEAVGLEEGEQRLLVMAALLIADELDECRAMMSKSNESFEEQSQQNLVEFLDNISDRLDALAYKIENE